MPYRYYCGDSIPITYLEGISQFPSELSDRSCPPRVGDPPHSHTSGDTGSPCPCRKATSPSRWYLATRRQLPRLVVKAANPTATCSSQCCSTMNCSRPRGTRPP